MKIQLKSGDLFSSTESLAHCISEDCRMGKGIAVKFKSLFGGVSEIQQQRAATGGLAVLSRGNRRIFYLVTKKHYYNLPSYDSLESSLICMREYCTKNNIKSISMPKIGCGLDRLQWSKVFEILSRVFSMNDINITVYVLI